jgi:hypothetical protein
MSKIRKFNIGPGGATMRVIRTEMYFDPDKVIWGEAKPAKNPGISAAWFKLGGELSTEDVAQHLLSDKYAKTVVDLSQIFDMFIDLSIQSIPSSAAEYAILKQDWRVANKDIVNFILGSDIVYEASPPDLLPIIKLAKGGSAVAVGTFLGYEVADGNLSYGRKLVTA